MTVISIKIPAKSGAALRRIDLSDGSKFTCSTDYLPFAAPGPGAELSPAEAAALRHAAACYRAERAALQYVARAEQHRAGLARKLEKKGLSGPEIAAALDHLEHIEIVSDRRYAEMWLRAKIRPALAGRALRTGPRKLAASLAGKGIALKTVRGALDAVLDPGTEAALLRAFAAASFRAGLPRRDGARRLLRAAGFSQKAIHAWLEDF
jgi:regulatory protein